jgi:serine/threonine-protein kinase HipA
MPAPNSQVREFETERAFVVERYDRVRRDDQWTRIHQEDVCQALGLPPERKYEQDGGPSAIDIAALIRESVSRDYVQADLLRFTDALIYNWLIVGTDAHAKNYSLLLAPGQVRLAPMYDLNSYLPYVSARKKPTLAMRIGSHKVRPDLIGAEDWRVFAKAAGVPEDHMFDRIRQLADRLPAAFHDAADDKAIRDLDSSLPAKLTDAIAAHAARCAAAAAGSRR